MTDCRDDVRPRCLLRKIIRLAALAFAADLRRRPVQNAAGDGSAAHEEEIDKTTMTELKRDSNLSINTRSYPMTRRKVLLTTALGVIIS
jgi:hypothetical protein